MKQRLWMIAGICVAGAAHALTPAEQTEMVVAHNQWRQQAGVPDVQWSPALAATAQQWADTLKARQACALTHSATPGLGENLFRAGAVRYSSGATQRQDVAPTRVVDGWAGEKRHYDYAGNTCAAGKMCGHYTQVVWKSTTEIGCAKAACGDNTQVWVCHYSPAGNWRGQKPY